MTFKQKSKKTLLVISYFALVPLLALVIFTVALSIYEGREWETQKAIVKQLVEDKAPKALVIEKLGTNYCNYSLGGVNEPVRMNFLTNDNSNRYTVEKDKLRKHPGALFYSTPYIMTWIFFDQNNLAVDYAMNQQ